MGGAGSFISRAAFVFMLLTTLKSQAVSDLAFIIADNPTAFTFGSRTYNGTRAALARSEKNELGGFEIDFDLALIVRLYSDFTATATTPPAVGDTVTIASTTYEVERITDDELGVGRRLDLRSQAR